MLLDLLLSLLLLAAALRSGGGGGCNDRGNAAAAAAGLRGRVLSELHLFHFHWALPPPLAAAAACLRAGSADGDLGQSCLL